VANTLLGNIALGYQFIWDAKRQPAGVLLSIATESELPMDARRLLQALNEFGSDRSPQLLLSIQSEALFQSVLQQSNSSSPMLEVSQDQLIDDALTPLIYQAHQRGAQLVWRGDNSHRPDDNLAACFNKHLLTLSTGEVLQGLHVAWHTRHANAQLINSAIQSPVMGGQLYEGVASRLLAEHCLDQQGAWGLLGWPIEEVQMGYRNQVVQPSLQILKRLIQALESDQSMESIERILCEDPVLVYRYLRHANSAGLGLRTEIQSVWQGLMAMGYTALEDWVKTQVGAASGDLNLNPLRIERVMRARLMEQLLEAGMEDELRREVYLCGLLTQIEGLLAEPLELALQRLPLPQRVSDALLNNAGPYAPYLRIACALGSDTPLATQALCQHLNVISPDDVNRALLKSLATLTFQKRAF
jgi:c-di-GMP phosphodiesterase